MKENCWMELVIYKVFLLCVGGIFGCFVIFCDGFSSDELWVIGRLFFGSF